MPKKPLAPIDRFAEGEVSLINIISGSVPHEEKKVVAREPKKPKKGFAKEDLKLCCFRIRNDQILAIGILHLKTRENVSGMARDALGKYLSDYLEDKTVNLRIPVTSPQTPKNELESKWFRLSPELIEALGVVAATSGVEKSEIVRDAIDEYLRIKDAE